MGKQPGFFFYTGDWLKDTRCLSLEARGAWIDLLCALWESPTRGEITWPIQAFDQYLGTIERDGLIYSAMEILEELSALQVCYIVTHDNKKVTVGNRRMVRVENERKSTASRVKRWRNKKSNADVTSPLPLSSSLSSSKEALKSPEPIKNRIAKVIGATSNGDSEKAEAIQSWIASKRELVVNDPDGLELIAQTLERLKIREGNGTKVKSYNHYLDTLYAKVKIDWKQSEATRLNNQRKEPIR